MGTLFISLQPVMLSAIGLPATAYTIRRLGPTEYGHWAMATSMVGAIAFLTNLGLRGTFVRSVARNPDTAKDALADQLGVRLPLTGVAVVLVLAACVILRYPSVVLACTALSCVSLALISYYTTLTDLLQSFHRFSTVAAVNIVAGVAVTAASAIAVWAGAGPIMVAAAYLVGPVLATITLCFILREYRPLRVTLNMGRFRSLLWESRFIAAQQLVGSVNVNAEALIIPKLLGAVPFGFFSAGTLLATRLTAVPDGLGSAAYPIVARRHVKSGRSALTATAAFLAVGVGSCLISAAMLTMLAGPIAVLLFPGKAELCTHVMRITVWLLPIMSIQCLLGYALNAVHADAQQARASAIATVLSLPVAGLLVWRYGLVGASWSMLTRYALQVVALLPCTYSTACKLWREDCQEIVDASPAGAIVQLQPVEV